MKKIIWLYYDGKKGHEKQSEAFLESLSKEIEIKIYKIKALSVLDTATLEYVSPSISSSTSG